MPKKKHRKHTPIKSEAQRGAMGAAYAAKKGKIPVSKLRGVSKEMYKSMPAAELKRHLEESGRKKLPKKKKMKNPAIGFDIMEPKLYKDPLDMTDKIRRRLPRV